MKRQLTNNEKQLAAIRSETDNPAIINDVMNTEFGVIPDSVELGAELSGYKQGYEQKIEDVSEAVVRHTVDGKTWNQVKGRGRGRDK